MLPRLIQTTIASISSEHAISTIFVPSVEIFRPPGRTLLDLIRELGIHNVIELPKLEAPSTSPVSIFPQLASPFSYVNETWCANIFFEGQQIAAQDLLTDLMHNDVIVVEQSPPLLKDLLSLFKDARGVAIGAWVGMSVATAAGNPMLMFITVPAGMLIVATASGLGIALEQGLRDTLLRYIKDFGK
jgi:hypothetical protein